MERVFFNVGRGYEAVIGPGTLNILSSIIKEKVTGARIAVVADDKLPESVVRDCVSIAEESGYEASVMKLEADERKKNIEAFLRVCGFLYDSSLTRADAMLALGGGTVGDIAGFAAASYLRGVGLISVPTTIIAQTDSAYGGKTGVDFRGGKNHIGAFKSPLAVVCDTELLGSLPEMERKNGMGEVIKYGAIASPSILEGLDYALPDERTIAECVRIKRGYVERDELDTGERHVLNFGHTFGHAIEEASGYTVPHGQAVAYGMLITALLGERIGVTESGVAESLESAVRAVGLSCEYSELLPSALPMLARDKKSDGRQIDAVLLKRLGEPVRMKLSFNDLSAAFEQKAE